jgi:hypothetical protein
LDKSTEVFIVFYLKQMHGGIPQTNICTCHTYLIESIGEIGIILWLTAKVCGLS